MGSNDVADVSEQVNAAVSSALVVPESALGVLVVTGSDRVSWLNGLVTCDLARIANGEAAYGLAVTQKGRILADVRILADGEKLLLLVPKVTLETLRASFDKYLIMEDVEVVDSTESYLIWSLHGPKSGELLDVAVQAGAFGARMDALGLKAVPSAVVLVVRSNLSVEPALFEAMGRSGGQLGDDAGWNALRLERGIARFGFDFDETTYPQEAALEARAVSFQKGCYLGQEVVCMLEMRGHVKRKLVHMVLDGEIVPEKGSPVTDEKGERVGEIASAAYSPTLKAPVALAMIKYAHIHDRAFRVAGTNAHAVAGALDSGESLGTS